MRSPLFFQCVFSVVFSFLFLFPVFGEELNQPTDQGEVAANKDALAPAPAVETDLPKAEPSKEIAEFIKKIDLAPEFLFESRNTETKTKANSTASEVKSKSSYFLSPRARLNLSTSLNDNLKFRMRLRFDKDGEALKKDTAGFTNNVDLFYVTHKLGESLEFTVGKYQALMGSVEYSVSGMEQYHKSGFDNETTNFQYATGFQLSYKLAGKLMFNAYNTSFSPDIITTTKPNGEFGYGLAWTGELGIFRPVLTYNLIPHVVEKSPVAPFFKSEKVSTSIAGLGTRIMLGDGTVSFEYDSYVTPEYKGLTSTTSGTTVTYGETTVKKESIDTFIVGYKHKIGRVTPVGKYSEDTYKSGGTKTVKYSQYSLGVEFRPTEHKGLWYYLALASKDKQYLNYENDESRTPEKREQTSAASFGMAFKF